MAQLTYRLAVRDALAEEMERDERVFLLGEDLRIGGVFNATRFQFQAKTLEDLDAGVVEPVVTVSEAPHSFVGIFGEETDLVGQRLV